MTMNRHEPFEELISASLTGDLSSPERQRLDAHLDACPQCRDTLAAFADQRRIMSGLRHVGPPRDLGARVRTGIERGLFANLPWWRRPAVLVTGAAGSLAAVAGALLALVILNGSPQGPQVGDASATPTPAVVESTETPRPTLPPIATLTPDASPDASPAESAAPPATPSATPNPIALAPEPDIFLQLTGSNDDPKLAVLEAKPAGESPTPIADLETPPGPPIAAELSPDGQWLAYITQVGQRGMNEVRATRVAEPPEQTDPEAPPPLDSDIPVGETLVLGESVAGAPFLERLAWSSEGRYLAFALLADPTSPEAGTDVWLFEPTSEDRAQRLTDTGNAFAGSWVPGTAGTSMLWISTAGDRPASYLHAFHEAANDPLEPMDPTQNAVASADGVFQPLLSPNGSLAIYWRGRMARTEDGIWEFAEAGAPQLAEHDVDDGTYDFTGERPVFSDLTVDRDAFTSASITWGGDGDAYAIWNTHWTGISQGENQQYPDPRRVYFGHATDPRGLTQQHAIDAGDIPEGMVVVDVKVSPTGRHLVITALEPPGGVGDVPRAELRLITRNTGRVADEIRVLGRAEDGWFGPAAFDQAQEVLEP